MCKSKCFTAIAIIASLLLAIGFTLLVIFRIVAPLGAGVQIAFILGVLVVGAVAFAATSLLRQDHKVDACICKGALQALIAGLLLIVLSTIAFLLISPSIYLALVFDFVLSALFVYSLFAVGCLYACIIDAGCHHHPCGCSEK